MITNQRGIEIQEDEIFVSDGAKCDCGNIVDIFDKNNKVAITDPSISCIFRTNVSQEEWQIQ